jgi:hypothetical protein
MEQQQYSSGFYRIERFYDGDLSWNVGHLLHIAFGLFFHVYSYRSVCAIVYRR